MRKFLPLLALTAAALAVAAVQTRRAAHLQDQLDGAALDADLTSEAFDDYAAMIAPRAPYYVTIEGLQCSPTGPFLDRHTAIAKAEDLARRHVGNTVHLLASAGNVIAPTPEPEWEWAGGHSGD